MNKLIGNIKYIIGGLTLLFIGFLIYNNFIKEEKADNVKEIIVGETSKEAADIISLLNKIENLSLDGSFFIRVNDDEGYTLSFSELIDFSRELKPKRPGKINPFLKGGSIDYNTDVIEDGGEETQPQEFNQVENIVQEEPIEN